MPDWCDNEVSVSSESLEEMKEFISFVKSTDNEEAFSFQSILPMPEELKNTISPPTIVSQEEKETSKRYKKKYGHGWSIPLGLHGQPLMRYSMH